MKKIKHLLAAFVCFFFTWQAAAQTFNVCGATPQGYVTIRINGIFGCGPGVLNKTVQYVENLPNGTELDICGENPPPGWVKTAILGNCFVTGNLSFLRIRIKRIDGMPNGTLLDICGQDAPPGWVRTAILGNCYVIGNLSFIRSRIQRIDGMPVGTVLDICGQNPPSGWVNTAFLGYCYVIGNLSFIRYRIQKISSRPAPGNGVPIGKNGIEETPGQYTLINNGVIKDGKNASTIIVNPPDSNAVFVDGNQQQPVVATPNPSKGSFNIQLKGFDHNLPLQYRITDMSGRVLETRQQLVNNNLNVGNALRAGMYLLEVTQGNMRQTVKLVKE